jgi:hypothetical protein
MSQLGSDYESYRTEKSSTHPHMRTWNLWIEVLRSYRFKSHNPNICDVIPLKPFPMKTSCFRIGPSGKRESRRELTNRWYLLVIADKYELDRRRFLKCFPHAWTHGKSSYNDVSVECRQKEQDSALFLVARQRTIIAQITLTETVIKSLSRADLEIYPWNEWSLSEKVDFPTTIQISHINKNIRRASLKAKIIDKSENKWLYSKLDGSIQKLSIATISDNTGSIELLLWNDQVDKVSVGDSVEIENGQVKMHRGQFQVHVGKRIGKLNVIKPTNTGPVGVIGQNLFSR